MQRVYQSIATVSPARTHLNVSGSKANMSTRVVSLSRCSPGLAGRTFPYGCRGRPAMSPFRFVLSRNSAC